MPSACTASSALNDHACENAYKSSDLQWATQGQGVGSWIEYDFGQNVLIRVTIMPAESYVFPW